MAITSAFQADDAGSIPATRSRFIMRLASAGFFLYPRHARRTSGNTTQKAPADAFDISVSGEQPYKLWRVIWYQIIWHVADRQTEVSQTKKKPVSGQAVCV
ncbi:TPA: hypothetical protein JS274_000007 [Escherichia coli]|nr:hypothetical protein [Escherichia coli]